MAGMIKKSSNYIVSFFKSVLFDMDHISDQECINARINKTSRAALIAEMYRHQIF